MHSLALIIREVGVVPCTLALYGLVFALLIAVDGIRQAMLPLCTCGHRKERHLLWCVGNEGDRAFSCKCKVYSPEKVK